MSGSGFAVHRVRRWLDAAAHVADAIMPRCHAGPVADAVQAGWSIDLPGEYCRRCGLSIGPSSATERGCSRCLEQRCAWDGIVRLTSYRAPMTTWITAMKFRRQWSWAEWLGDRLAERIDVCDNATIVCPVPMHWRRRLARGYNQSALIADTIARRKGIQSAALLRRRRFSPPQTRTTATDRRLNARGAFAVGAVDLSGWTVWLVDDVKTTGATLSACCSHLRQAGAGRIHVAVAAVADPGG